MNPLSRSTIPRLFVACAAALVLVAPASARVMLVGEGDSGMLGSSGRSAVATVAKRQTTNGLAQSGWGAAATYAKQQTRATLAANAENELLAQYGWGAAATYAKLHG